MRIVDDIIAMNNKWISRVLVACVIVGFGAAVSAETVQVEGCTLRVFFANNVSSTTSQQNARITSFVEGASSDVFAVRGFASNLGASANNVRLSEQRAVRVGNVVSAAGYRFQVVALGEAGSDAFARRAEIYRDDCAAAIVPEATGVVPLTGLGLGGAGITAAVIGIAAAAAAGGGGGSTPDTQ